MREEVLKLTLYCRRRSYELECFSPRKPRNVFTLCRFAPQLSFFKEVPFAASRALHTRRPDCLSFADILVAQLSAPWNRCSDDYGHAAFARTV